MNIVGAVKSAERGGMTRYTDEVEENENGENTTF